MIIVFSLKNNFFQASVVLYQCCIAYSAYSEEKINVINDVQKYYLDSWQEYLREY